MKNKWRYYDGTTSSNSILKDLSKVLCNGVKAPAITDDTGTVVKPTEVILDRNWDVVYPPVDKSVFKDVVDWNRLSPKEFEAKINHQASRIGTIVDGRGETVILKTRTTPVNIGDFVQNDLGLEDDLGVSSIDMYLEIYKPKYLANLETYEPECERKGINPLNITRGIMNDILSDQANESIRILGLKQNGTGISVVPVDKEETKRTISTTSNAKRMPVNPSDRTGNDRLVTLLGEIKGFSIGPTTKTWSSSENRFDVSSLTSSQRAEISQLSGIIIDNYDKIGITLLNGEVTPDYEYENYGYKYYYLLKATMVMYNVDDKYKINTGATIKIDNDQVMAETIEIALVNTVNGSKVKLQKDVYYEYSPSNNTITFKKSCPETGEYFVAVDGDPTLTFTYAKKPGNGEDIPSDKLKLVTNNHHVFVRMFDKIEDDPTSPMYMKGPKADIKDLSSGELLQINSHVSEWSKLSWYQDFEDVLLDELDTDVGTSDISQGLRVFPIETPGLNGDTKLQMWINTSNDRVIMCLMGNPSLDFSKNRHLTSLAYFGRIESFENSINDTAGNFALLTSSSTVPCSTISYDVPTIVPIEEKLGEGSTNASKVYTVNLKKVNQQINETGKWVLIFKDKINADQTVSHAKTPDKFDVLVSDDKKSCTVKLVIDPPKDTNFDILLQFEAIENSSKKIEGVERDEYGNILEIRYPETWGKNTATGVTDISMLHTRSKAYFQKHHFMFTTTEEYMTKEMYGKSAYTGEYYADRIKITHGNDGPRGMLQDMLVIDQSSLVALDELIVNRDFSKKPRDKEETYIYFPVTAPYSPLAGSPNAMFGVAVKKQERLPAPLTDEEAVDRIIESMYVGRLNNILEDIVLPTTTENGVTVTWTSNNEAITIQQPGAKATLRARK